MQWLWGLFGAVENLLSDFLHRIKIRTNVEFSTNQFLLIFMVIALLIIVLFRWIPILIVDYENNHSLMEYANHHSSVFKPFKPLPSPRRDMTLSDWFGYMVSFFNFIGVMFISRGVILLRKNAKDLDEAVANPADFPGVTRDLIKESSKNCELGTLFVAVAFVFDMISRAIS